MLPNICDCSHYLIWKYFKFSKHYWSLNHFYPEVLHGKTTEKPVMIQMHKVYILLKFTQPTHGTNLF